MEELIKVLEKTVSSSQADQNEAVKYIQDCIQNDFTGFLQILADVLYEPQNPPVVRAAAGLQLKNQLTARDETLRQQQQERWKTLPNETKLHIKEKVFKALGTEMFKPSSAPQLLAYITIIELPEGQCPGLIEALATNVTSTQSSQQLRLASLEALGYICQDIDQTCIQQSDSAHILNAIVHGLQSDMSEDIGRAATTALSSLYADKIQKISGTNQSISFEDLGRSLNLESQFAERILAQMIRDERIQGYLDQVKGIAYFDKKDTLQLFDDEILNLCSDVNDIIEKIKNVVPHEWWAMVMR